MFFTDEEGSRKSVDRIFYVYYGEITTQATISVIRLFSCATLPTFIRIPKRKYLKILCIPRVHLFSSDVSLITIHISWECTAIWKRPQLLSLCDHSYRYFSSFISNLQSEIVNVPNKLLHWKILEYIFCSTYILM